MSNIVKSFVSENEGIPTASEIAQYQKDNRDMLKERIFSTVWDCIKEARDQLETFACIKCVDLGGLSYAEFMGTMKSLGYEVDFVEDDLCPYYEVSWGNAR